MERLMKDYECPDCGQSGEPKAFDCCDTCILKFYFDNPNASKFGE